jgi:hypothetical protein
VSRRDQPGARDVIVEAACSERQIAGMKVQAAGMTQRRTAGALNAARPDVRRLLVRAQRGIRIQARGSQDLAHAA